MSAHFSSLYVHFPFCESKCHYCDFYSIGREKTGKDDPSTFERAMIQEAKLWRDELAPLKTIFFGGGTPSMTHPDSMAKICDAIFDGSAFSNGPSKSVPKLAPDYEWTMEANPSSVSLENFRAYRALGLNRISMGVQSMNNEQLLRLGRVHNEEAVPRALSQIFESGITNASCDLLCGVPGQTRDDLDLFITKLLKFPLNHISIYLLTLPPHHKMFKDLPSDEEQLAHLHFIHDRLAAEGFRHYEISNFARPGFEAKHNLVYWTGGSYLGLGPSAHSFDSVKRTRFKNVSSLHKWASLLNENKKPVEWSESLTADQIALEDWMLALRLDTGFPREWINTSAQLATATKFLNEGVLEIHPELKDRIRIHHRSWPLSDAIIKALAV